MDSALPRALCSLSPGSQRGIDATDYELIVVDNGSPTRPDEAALTQISPNVRLIQLEATPPSPVQALNVGAAAAQGDVLGFMIDGGHIVTPRALSLGLRAVSTIERAVALMPAFNL